MKPYAKSNSFIATAGGYELDVQGIIHLQPKFGGSAHPHTFLVAEVNQPILGYPFLRDHKATINTAQSEVVFQCTCKPASRPRKEAIRAAPAAPVTRPTGRDTADSSQPQVKQPGRDAADSSQPRVRQPGRYGTAVPSSRPPQSFTVPTPKQTYASVASINVNKLVELSRQVQQEFEDIACDGIPTSSEPLHGVKHVINTVGDPVRQTYRRLDAARLEIAKRYFTEMCNMGVCKRANSPWASPLHMVPKPD